MMPRDPKTGNVSTMEAFSKLVEIVHRLRAPGGCPWDREQTPKSLKSYIVEETYEVLDAIDEGDAASICEELGDLLLQVVLQSEIAAENGEFDIVDVVNGISHKLVQRHPHVFGSVEVDGADEVLTNWEQLKQKEKKGRGLFDGLPKALPALQRSYRIGEKAARVGFDWPGVKEVRQKVSEELAELDEAAGQGDPSRIEHEAGDLLFAVAQWARHLKTQPEEALLGCCARFLSRFGKMERMAAELGKTLKEWRPEELDRAWEKAKRQ